MPKGSDNPFPSLLIVEGADPANPAAGDQRLFIDSTDHKLKRVRSDGTIVTVEGGTSPLTTKGDLYGHSTVDARIPVGTDGEVLTADSTQALGLKWAAVAAGGGLTKLYEVTLGADTAALDTGASAIAATATHLLIVAALRTTGATATDDCNVQFNGDTNSANYGDQMLQGTSGSTGASQSNSVFALWTATGASSTSSVVSATLALIPLYAGTTFNKTMMSLSGAPVSRANSSWADRMHTDFWLSTAAINRIKVIPTSGGNVAAGSYMVVYGL